ncbi:tectonin domain-containing protein [Leptolyngbya sp. PCC 6406]|uniref:tectonin domain-containing protein n=1 Tax=Leptolyngbya sp. PCC 6406 TaxID=1173264 RepID=UPI000481F321|nr:tectonin domain-containing protein [Leptolyngbya sp. PCC 6406]
MKLFGSLRTRRQPAKGFVPQPTEASPVHQTFLLEQILTPSGLLDTGEDAPDGADIDLSSLDAEADVDGGFDPGDLEDTPPFDIGNTPEEDLEDIDFIPPPEDFSTSLSFEFESGVFTVGESGEVTIDYLFDGGSYQGELAIFSLEGMEEFELGSEDFIREAARRALTGTEEGHIVIRDRLEGARFGEYNPKLDQWNSGDYLGAKTFQMKAGDEFGLMLVPRGRVWSAFNNPRIDSSGTPLFSMATANPDDMFAMGQIADVFGDGNTFAFEDIRVDRGSDLDYNDIVFQVRGAEGKALYMGDLVDPSQDWRSTDIGRAIHTYAESYVAPFDSSLAISASAPPAAQPLVGIIDTGLTTGHPDLNYNNITSGWDWVDGNNNSFHTLGAGDDHGTFVASKIAAIRDNGIGIDGINDQSPIWVSRAVGSGQWANSLTEFVDAAIESGQPNAVVNLSFDLTQIDTDGNVTTRYEFTPQEREAIEYARQNGVLMVVAAGNDGGVMSVLGQAAQEFDNILTVGAADGLGKAAYSSYGNGLGLLAAGGTAENPVVSLMADGLGTMAGTSVATAQVTGAVSQVWAANPQLSYRQVIEILQATATDLNTPGWDAQTGAGLLNLPAALLMAKATSPKPYDPEPWFTPQIWSGSKEFTTSERAVNGTGTGYAQVSSIPQNLGAFIKEEMSNGVTVRYYTKGYLTIQPSGHQSWYAVGTGLPVTIAPSATPQRLTHRSTNLGDSIYQLQGDFWAEMPGKAKDISVGADGSVWVIGTEPESGGYSIYNWNGQGWNKVGGSAVRIAVAPDGTPWVVNSKGNIYKRENNVWRQMPGQAKDIGIGADSSVWVIGTEPESGGYGIYNWNGQDWNKVGGSAVRIAVAPDGTPWVVNSKGAIYKRENNAWRQMPGTAKDIGIGADGSVWVIGTQRVFGGYTIHRWNGTGWDRQNGGGVQITVTPNGNPWVVSEPTPNLPNSGNHIYQRSHNTWRQMPGQAKDIGIGADGSVWVIGTGSESGGYGIYSWNGINWDKVGGSAVRVAVAPDGTPWVVNSKGTIYKRENNAWRRMPGQAKDIGIGADGSVWVIGTGAESGGYGIYRWNGTNWDKVGGSAVHVAVAPDGTPWVVNSQGTIYKRENNVWRPMPGKANDIGIGADGSVWVIGTGAESGGYGIYRWNGQGWDNVGGSAVQIAVAPDGTPWVVNADPKVASGGYYAELSALSRSEWNQQSKDNLFFDGKTSNGESSLSVKQIYSDLSNEIFGSYKAMTAGYFDNTNYSGTHYGIDMAGLAGDAVRAVVGGTTTLVQNIAGNYFVGVKGDDGNLWIYGHLENYSVGIGQTITKGMKIGTVFDGAYLPSGYWMAQHLHLEVHEGHSYNRSKSISPLQAYWRSRNL